MRGHKHATRSGCEGGLEAWTQQVISGPHGLTEGLARLTGP